MSTESRLVILEIFEGLSPLFFSLTFAFEKSETSLISDLL